MAAFFSCTLLRQVKSGSVLESSEGTPRPIGVQAEIFGHERNYQISVWSFFPVL